MVQSEKKAAPDLILRFDADRSIGAGHMARCMALGRIASATGLTVLFAGKQTLPAMVQGISDAGFSYMALDKKLSWADEADWLVETIGGSLPPVVLDLSTPYAIGDPAGFSEYLKKLRAKGRVLLIDGLDETAVLHQIDARPHVAVVPYVGAGDPKDNGCTWLMGPKYFIFQPEYTVGTQKPNSVPDIARRILVTYGGSDPKSGTLVALNALSGFTDLEIRVIVGPGFSPELISAIREKSEAIENSMELVHAPRSLYDHMVWCDMAVAASGLTKYELALTGTPSIQVSLNPLHAEVNRPFAGTGAAEHLGIHEDVTPELLAAAVSNLSKDGARRMAMIQAGRHLVDANGGNRVLNAALG